MTYDEQTPLWAHTFLAWHFFIKAFSQHELHKNTYFEIINYIIFLKFIHEL